jgi:hypothetical protein
VHPYFASIGLGTAFLLTFVTLIILLVAYIRLARKSNNYEIIEEEILTRPALKVLGSLGEVLEEATILRLSSGILDEKP